MSLLVLLNVHFCLLNSSNQKSRQDSLLAFQLVTYLRFIPTILISFFLVLIYNLKVCGSLLYFIYLFIFYFFFLYSHNTVISYYFFFTYSKHMVVLYHLNLFNFFNSHFQNNLIRHHQLVFYFIFKRNIVKSKYDFFRVDLNLKKIKEFIPNNLRTRKPLLMEEQNNIYIYIYIYIYIISIHCSKM